MPMTMPMNMNMNMPIPTAGSTAHGDGTSAPLASWSRYAGRWGRALGLELIALALVTAVVRRRRSRFG
jgi:hypothetical protein